MILSNDDEDAGDPLDDEFPLGDGVADTAAFVVCPYCGAEIEIVLDPGGGPDQHYVEDCEVCCRPCTLHVRWSRSGAVSVEALTEEEAG